jgi:hypothetical protein
MLDWIQVFLLARNISNLHYVGSATVPTYHAGTVACPTKDPQSFVDAGVANV